MTAIMKKKQALLMLIALMGVCPLQAQEIYQVHDTIKVNHHELHVDVRDFQGKVLHGKAKLQVESKLDGIGYIPLQLLRMQVDSVWVNGLPVNAGVQYNDALLRVPMPYLMSKGDKAEVTVAYHGVPVEQRFGGFTWREKDRMAHNMGVSINDIPHSYGKAWYPAVDDFRAKSLYDVYIQTDGDLKGIGNGLLQESEKEADGSMVWHWKLNQPVPDYLVNVAVGDYRQIHMEHRQSDRVVPIDVYVLPQEYEEGKQAYAVLPDVMKVLDEKFGAFNFDRVGFVSVNTSGGAMEHATNISMPRNPKPTASYQELFIHELIHSWFGNRVTCQTAEDMWLNEGMTTWAVEVVLESLFSGEQLHAYRQSTQNTALMAAAREGGYRALSGMPQEYTYSSTVYQKGAWVMRTLRSYLGDELFFKGMQQYVRDYTFATATTGDFQKTMERVTGKDLNAFFQNLIHEGGFRVLKAELLKSRKSGNGFQTEVALHRELMGVKNAVADSWKIPVQFWSKDGRSEVALVNFDWEKQVTLSTAELPFRPVYALVDPYQTVIKGNMLEQFTLNTNTEFQSRACSVEVNQPAETDGVLNVEYIPVAASGADTPYYWRVYGVMPKKHDITMRLTVNRMKDRLLYGEDVETAPVKVLYRPNAQKPWKVISTEVVNLKERNPGVEVKAVNGEYTLAY